MIVDFIVDSIGGVVDLFEWGLLGFAVGGDLGVMLFDFVSDLE